MRIARRSGEVFVIRLDPEDEERVLAAGPWGVKTPNARSRTAYVQRTVRDDGRKTAQLLHRWLLDAPPGIQVDHINGDGLDNRRSNLRMSSASDNKANARLYRNNRHGFKGATPYRSRWRAQIVRGGQHYALGIFDTPEEAHAAYCAAAERFHGEFAHRGK